jgi:hypothetical protein
VRQPILISRQSLSVYQLLINDQDPGNAHFLLKALDGIRQDPKGYGRPFRGGPGGPARKEVVALQRTQQLQQQQVQQLLLCLFWNPTAKPIVIKLVLL